MNLGQYLLQLFVESFDDLEFGAESRGLFVIIENQKITYGWSEYENEKLFPVTFAVEVGSVNSSNLEEFKTIAITAPSFGGLVTEIDPEGNSPLFFYCNQFFVREKSIDSQILRATIQEIFFFLSEN